MARIAAVAMEGVSLAITASRSSSCGTPPPLEAMCKRRRRRRRRRLGAAAARGAAFRALLAGTHGL